MPKGWWIIAIECPQTIAASTTIIVDWKFAGRRAAELSQNSCTGCQPGYRDRFLDVVSVPVLDRSKGIVVVQHYVRSSLGASTTDLAATMMAAFVVDPVELINQI